MKTFSFSSFAAIITLALLTPLRGADQGATMNAQELATRLSALEEDGSSFVRLHMESKGTTFQLQIKQRRSSAGNDVVYQLLWPKERKGESVLIRQVAGHAPSGVLFAPPDKSETIDLSKMKSPLFDSDLSYADIAENFFAWPHQALVGTEDIKGTPCPILESKPGKGSASIYGMVKSWIDVRHLVPMRVEKYLSSGQLARRIDTTNVETDDRGRQLPASLAVRRPGFDSVTTIEGSRIKHDVKYSDEDFTAAGLKNIAAPR